MKTRGKITSRQKDLLKHIYNSLKTEGFPPSFEELKTALNISSNQAIIDHLNSLEKKGYIKREEKYARGIKINPLGYKALKVQPLIQMLGNSYAGTFTESFTQSTWLTLSNHIEKLEEQIYIVKIKGDSMINAGIYDNDMLLAKDQKYFSSGDIVIAKTCDGTTVKRFIRQNKPPFIFLKPENPKYEIILFTDDVAMQGKIIGKYNNGEVVSLKQGAFI